MIYQTCANLRKKLRHKACFQKSYLFYKGPGHLKKYVKFFLKKIILLHKNDVGIHYYWIHIFGVYWTPGDHKGLINKTSIYHSLALLSFSPFLILSTFSLLRSLFLFFFRLFALFSLLFFCPIIIYSFNTSRLEYTSRYPSLIDCVLKRYR